jgi:hypothetical protein
LEVGYDLVVRVLGYRSGGPGSIPGTTRKKVMGLERGPLSLMSTTEELLDRKVLNYLIYFIEWDITTLNSSRIVITFSFD